MKFLKPNGDSRSKPLLLLVGKCQRDVCSGHYVFIFDARQSKVGATAEKEIRDRGGGVSAGAGREPMRSKLPLRAVYGGVEHHDDI